MRGVILDVVAGSLLLEDVLLTMVGSGAVVLSLTLLVLGWAGWASLLLEVMLGWLGWCCNLGEGNCSGVDGNSVGDGKVKLSIASSISSSYMMSY